MQIATAIANLIVVLDICCLFGYFFYITAVDLLPPIQLSHLPLRLWGYTSRLRSWIAYKRRWYRVPIDWKGLKRDRSGHPDLVITRSLTTRRMRENLRPGPVTWADEITGAESAGLGYARYSQSVPSRLAELQAQVDRLGQQLPPPPRDQFQMEAQRIMELDRLAQAARQVNNTSAENAFRNAMNAGNYNDALRMYLRSHDRD